MKRANNFPSGFQLLIEPGGPLEGAVDEKFRETVGLSSAHDEVRMSLA
jgi:hypothetical protein